MKREPKKERKQSLSEADENPEEPDAVQQQTLSEHLSREKGKVRAVGSGQLGWSPGCTTRFARFGGISLRKGSLDLPAQC